MAISVSFSFLLYKLNFKKACRVHLYKNSYTRVIISNVKMKQQTLLIYHNKNQFSNDTIKSFRFRFSLNKSSYLSWNLNT